jgi:hypothetical protein
MKMSEFTKQMKKLIIEYLTVTFQCEMISEVEAIKMAKEWVKDHTDSELYKEYKRLTA